MQGNPMLLCLTTETVICQKKMMNRWSTAFKEIIKPRATAQICGARGNLLWGGHDIIIFKLDIIFKSVTRLNLN
jgi:hypothetical protein